MPFIDDIYQGPAATGLYQDGAAGVGIGPLGRVLVYDVVPLTLQVNNLATSQSPGTAALTLTAGTGVTSVTVSGVPVLQLDIPRILRFVSGGNDTGITFNVVGFDQYNQAMTENVTGASGGTASGKKAFYQVATITPSAGISSTITVGTGDVFGLPLYIPNATYVTGVQWNSTLAKDTGTLVTGVTTTATHTTGDVRGTYAPQSGASDGAKRLVMTFVVSQAQVGSSATRATVLGVTQA